MEDLIDKIKELFEKFEKENNVEIETVSVKHLLSGGRVGHKNPAKINIEIEI